MYIESQRKKRRKLVSYLIFPVSLHILEMAKVMCGRVNMVKTFVYFVDPTFFTVSFFPPASKYPSINSLVKSSAAFDVVSGGA